jgi:hypothetical protein
MTENVADPYAKAAEKYQPKSTPCILFVAEAPPSNIDRYFYFEDVKRGDWLWIALMKALYPSEWEWGSTKMERQRKRAWLTKFQAYGYQLIDAVKKPLNSSLRYSQRVSVISKAAPDLFAEISTIHPTQIVLIRATVHEALFQEMKDAGLPVVDQPLLPFPSAGQQGQFADGFRKLINDEKLRLCTTKSD